MGLKLCDLEAKNLALKAAWPIRWKDKETDEIKWFFENLPIPDNRLWEGNLDPKDLQNLLKNNKFSVAPNILVAWAHFSYKPVVIEYEEILNETLWGNSHIRRRDKPIFDSALLSSNINRVLDIVDISQHQLLTFEEYEEQYGRKIDPLLFYGLRAAIPPLWKNTIKQETLSMELDFEPKVEVFSKYKRTSKFMYWKIIEERYPVSDALVTIWNADLNIKLNSEAFYDLLPIFLSQIKPSKLRNFQYRILTRLLTTNRI